MKKLYIKALDIIWRVISFLLWNRLWYIADLHYFIRGEIIALQARIDKTRKPWAVLGLHPGASYPSVDICYRALTEGYQVKLEEIEEAYQAILQK